MTVIVDRAVQRGETPAGTDSAEIIRTVTALIYYRLFIAGEQPSEGGVAHADLALEQLTGEESDHSRHLVRASRAEQARDLVDLDAAARGRGHGLRGEHQLGQQHNRIVPEGPDA